MAGEQKRKARKLLVTKALLLGYSIELQGMGVDGTLWYNIQLPNGCWQMEDGLPAAFPAQWVAAKAALEHAGVKDAKPRRGKGIGSCKSFRLRGGRRKRGRVQGIFEGSGS